MSAYFSLLKACAIYYEALVELAVEKDETVAKLLEIATMIENRIHVLSHFLLTMSDKIKT